MNRRGVLGLLAGATMSLPPAAEAAGEPSKVFHLGALEPGPPGRDYRTLLLQLFELGYEEGRNLRIDYVLFDSTNADRSLGMATELVNHGVDAILAVGPEVALKSAVAATKTIPIVMQANDYDPLTLGYIASLARPGGNVTGVFVQQIELIPKRLQLLTQMVPDLVRVVALWDRLSTDQFEAARSVAQGLKITLDGIECTDPPYDYESMLAGVDGRRRDVLLQMTSPLFFQDRQRLPAVALAHRLPSMFAFRQWVDAGGLMSYGASLSDMGRLIADYVDRIAKGAKPADLPVQQPAKFELVINLKTANALGQTIPPSTLARADAIIE